MVVFIVMPPGYLLRNFSFILKWTQGDLLSKRLFCDLKRSKRHCLLTLSPQMVSWSNLNYIMTSDTTTKNEETLSLYFKNSRMSYTPRMPDFKTASQNDSGHSPFIHQKLFKEKKRKKLNITTKYNFLNFRILRDWNSKMENESSTERKIFGKLHMLSEVSIYRSGHTVYLTHTLLYFQSVFLGLVPI